MFPHAVAMFADMNEYNEHEDNWIEDTAHSAPVCLFASWNRWLPVLKDVVYPAKRFWITLMDYISLMPELSPVQPNAPPEMF
jgi:hypothetical protein